MAGAAPPTGYSDDDFDDDVDFDPEISIEWAAEGGGGGGGDGEPADLTASELALLDDQAWVGSPLGLSVVAVAQVRFCRHS